MPEPETVNAVLLCGGLGTRLRGVVDDRAKPMVDVCGRPFLAILIDFLSGRGFDEFVLCVGHRADTIRAYFHDDQRRRFIYSEEPSPRGTAGALRLAAPLLRPLPTLVLNGDSFCPVVPADIFRAHFLSGAAATIAVAPAGERVDAGGVEFDASGRVTAFREKGKTVPAWINAGVYVISPQVIAAIPEGRSVSLEREIFPSLVGQGLLAYPVQEPVFDIGTPERLEAFRRIYDTGQLNRYFPY